MRPNPFLLPGCHEASSLLGPTGYGNNPEE
jgi:hypothetical protein